LLEAQLKDMEESIRLVCRSSSPPGHTYAYVYVVCVCGMRLQYAHAAFGCGGEYLPIVCRSSSPPGHTNAHAYVHAHAVCACICRIWRRVSISASSARSHTPVPLTHTPPSHPSAGASIPDTTGCMLTDADECTAHTLTSYTHLLLTPLTHTTSPAG
jgi:hypothetical protein